MEYKKNNNKKRKAKSWREILVQGYLHQIHLPIMLQHGPVILSDPIFSFSPLAIHTRNLLADPRCTLVVQVSVVFPQAFIMFD